MHLLHISEHLFLKTPLHGCFCTLIIRQIKLQIKHFKDHTFIGMHSLFTWFNIQGGFRG